ncbi:hypothetical protein [Duganella aceris]|uniref:Uncharacterized protein n=1 Tax=Duganella aceris TaxID=2703883 RepID=A0ABX0FUY5_9BURK|nr:hypothetical protein [Duganella aceris]NGZ88521.1 hypothetical protein [Duganella aceris]
MNSLLNLILEAHGGMPRWNQFNQMSARLTRGGMLWPLLGKMGMLDEVDIKINLHQAWAAHTPDGGVADSAVGAGVMPKEMVFARDALSGHQLNPSWSDAQLNYFVGYAMWNYLSMPFLLSRPGFVLTKLTDWQENGQTWHRLSATFPPDIATHSPVQTFYFSADGLLRRHDYEVEVAGGVPAAHYLSGHTTVQGITLPTRHMIYVRNAELGDQPAPLMVSIGLSDIKLA